MPPVRLEKKMNLSFFQERVSTRSREPQNIFRKEMKNNFLFRKRNFLFMNPTGKNAILNQFHKFDKELRLQANLLFEDLFIEKMNGSQLLRYVYCGVDIVSAFFSVYCPFTQRG